MRLKLRPSYLPVFQLVLGGTRGGIGGVDHFAAWHSGRLSVRVVPLAAQNYKFASSIMPVMFELRHVRTLVILGLMTGTCLPFPLSLRSQITFLHGWLHREHFCWNIP